jgi:glycogen synthase
MKILLWSYAFSPSIGGLEQFSHMMAEQFVALGHEVTIVTRTPSAKQDKFSFPVVRQPSWKKLFQLVGACDVYLQNHISLKAAWPLLFVRRPWIVTIQTWISDRNLRGSLKHYLLRYSRPIACSHEIAAGLRVPSTVINNCYDERIFRTNSERPRNKDLIFVGRLAPEKGVLLLLQALRLLQAKGLKPSLTVVGDGPERESLISAADEAGLRGQVTFAGPMNSGQIATALNEHRILVVPSLYREPFGIVALEGIACGCVIVGSEGGGLKDAIGSCGLLFPNENLEALVERLAYLVPRPELLSQYRCHAPEHLQRFTSVSVARSYLDLLSSARAA